MQSAKARVQQMLEGLSDDVTLADIRYHLYVISRIEEGDRAIREGRMIDQEDLEKEIETWLRE